MAATAERENLIAVLDFHVAAGVDLALDEAPHDRFAEDATQRPETAPEPARPVPPSPRREIEASKPAAAGRTIPDLPRAAAAAPDEIAALARERVREVQSLEALREMLAAFDGCTLKASAKQLAFADGTPGARVMLLGEAPGAEEDRTGKPFVGRAGQLLDRMLAAIGLDRTGVYIANVVPWRPPGNRTPTPQEVAICLPFTLRQIELARPDILVTLGAAATHTLVGGQDGIMRMRGRWQDFELGERRLLVLPMLHPAYLLRSPVHKRLAWRDLRALKRALDETGGRT